MRKKITNPSHVPLAKCALIRCKQRALKFPQFLKLVTLSFTVDVFCKRLLVLIFDGFGFLKIRIHSAYSGSARSGQAWNQFQTFTNATGATNHHNTRSIEMAKAILPIRRRRCLGHCYRNLVDDDYFLPYFNRSLDIQYSDIRNQFCAFEVCKSVCLIMSSPKFG